MLITVPFYEIEVKVKLKKPNLREKVCAIWNICVSSKISTKTIQNVLCKLMLVDYWIRLKQNKKYHP